MGERSRYVLRSKEASFIKQQQQIADPSTMASMAIFDLLWTAGAAIHAVGRGPLPAIGDRSATVKTDADDVGFICSCIELQISRKPSWKKETHRLNRLNRLR